MSRAALVWALAVAPLCAACGRGAGAAAPPARVFAAASLTEAFGALAEAFSARRPEHAVELHFAGTPTLALQLREGAPADVFASADEDHMARVVALGLTAAPPRLLAASRLALAVAPGNPRGVEGLADLAREDLQVALCGPQVPGGRYARRALERAGVAVRSVSDEPSVKALVAKVALGELDAAVVYATDVRAAAGAVDGVPVPDAWNVAVAYSIAPLRGGPNPAAGAAFVDFALSAEGGAVLRSFGFEAP